MSRSDGWVDANSPGASRLSRSHRPSRRGWRCWTTSCSAAPRTSARLVANQPGTWRRSTRCWPGSISSRWPIVHLRRSRAGSDSGPSWRGHWRKVPPCSCSTSQRPHWTLGTSRVLDLVDELRADRRLTIARNVHDPRSRGGRPDGTAFAGVGGRRRIAEGVLTESPVGTLRRAGAGDPWRTRPSDRAGALAPSLTAPATS